MPTRRKAAEASDLRDQASSYGSLGGEVVFYRSADGVVRLDVKLEKDTVWLSQKQMALLFEKNSDTIGLHIRNAFKEKELDEQASGLCDAVFVSTTWTL